jgi:class 3 adenylate cyclase/tetratricopeptide (TPR) repeat protein
VSDSGTQGEVRTFLIADVRGYTHFTLERGDEAAAQLAMRFAELSEEVLAAFGGAGVQLRGDEALTVFVSSRQALRAALELQHRFGQESSDSLPLKVGIGLDAGEAVPVSDGYRGAALNLAARLCSLAGAGEVLATDTVTGIAGKLDGLEYADRGRVQLKGFTDPVHVVLVVPEDGGDSPARETASHGADSRPQQLPIGGFLGALPSGPLVGRDDEVVRIRNAIEAASRGEGRLLVLDGEPGVGKTRLAQETTLELRNRGFLITTGSSVESRQSIPYYPFLDVLTTLYGAVSSQLRTQTARQWPSIGRLLPEAGIQRQESKDEPDEPEQLLRAVVSFVRAAADETPVSILLDDMQWADESSLDLLARLARQTRGDRVLLLATYRDLDVPRQHPLERTLLDLHRAGLTERIAVQRLGLEGTRALMAASLDTAISDDFSGFVYSRTEGNPFFTQEVLHSLIERGDVYRENGSWERREVDELDVPESVRSMIGERLSRLPEKTQELLGEASVLGPTFGFDELRALGSHAEDDVERGLDEAMEIGIIRETTGDQYDFNHALTQSTLYAGLSGRRKRRLHLAAGEALEGLPEQHRAGREAELAWHFARGDDSVRALRYSLLAGDRAEDVFAHGEAIRHYDRACNLARELGDDAHLREALGKLGATLNLMGRYDAAGEALEETIRLSRRAGDLDGEIEAVMDIMRHAPERGSHESTREWIEPLLGQLEDSPVSRRKLAFFNAYAYFLVQTMQFEQGMQVAKKTVEMADALGDEHEVARAKVRLGHMLLWHGTAGEVQSLLEPVASYLEEAGDLPEAMRAVSLLAQVSWFSGDRRFAGDWREHALRLAQQVGDAAQVVFETCMLGYQHMREGAMDEAWETGERALADARALDRSTMTGSPLGLLGTLSWIQGKWEDLERYAGEMIALSDRSDEPWWRRHGGLLRSLHDLLEERTDRAIARLETLASGAELDIQEQTLYLPALAEAHLRVGSLERARQALGALPALQALQMDGMLADTLRVHAMVFRAGGDLSSAETVLNRALAVTRSMPYPFAEARALAEFSELEATRGHTTEAQKHAEEALAIFQRLGAQPFVERTKRAKTRLGKETAPDG